jgi:hypothetical protein
MILSCWRLKSLAALVLDQPTELAGLPAGLKQWQRLTDKNRKKMALAHTLPSCMLVFFGGLLGVKGNLRFESLEEAQSTMRRQNCLHMGLEYQASEQFLANYYGDSKQLL